MKFSVETHQKRMREILDQQAQGSKKPGSATEKLRAAIRRRSQNIYPPRGIR